MRVALVEDDSLLRGSVSVLLGGERGFEVVGAFGSAEEALAGLAQGNPEVMLVDIDLPGMNGIELIREVKRHHPEVELMAFTILEDRDTVFAAIKAGASGYLLKGSPPREVVESLHTLYQGGAPMTPRIAKKVLLEMRGEGGDETEGLSVRERDILAQIQKGMSYREIGEQFYISPHTVHSHIKRIYEKLQARGRKEALLKARRQGIL